MASDYSKIFFSHEDHSYMMDRKKQDAINELILSNNLEVDLLYRFKQHKLSDPSKVWDQLFKQDFRDLSEVESFDGVSFRPKFHSDIVKKRLGSKSFGGFSLSNDNIGNLILEKCKEKRTDQIGDYWLSVLNSRTKMNVNRNDSQKIVRKTSLSATYPQRNVNEWTTDCKALRKTISTPIILNNDRMDELNGNISTNYYKMMKVEQLENSGFLAIKNGVLVRNGTFDRKNDKACSSKIKFSEVKPEISEDRMTTAQSDIFLMDDVKQKGKDDKKPNNKVRFWKHDEATNDNANFAREIIFARKVYDDDQEVKNDSSKNSLLSMQLNGQVVCSFSRGLKIRPKHDAGNKIMGRDRPKSSRHLPREVHRRRRSNLVERTNQKDSNQEIMNEAISRGRIWPVCDMIDRTSDPISITNVDDKDHQRNRDQRKNEAVDVQDGKRIDGKNDGSKRGGSTKLLNIRSNVTIITRHPVKKILCFMDKDIAGSYEKVVNSF